MNYPGIISYTASVLIVSGVAFAPYVKSRVSHRPSESAVTENVETDMVLDNETSTSEQKPLRYSKREEKAAEVYDSPERTDVSSASTIDVQQVPAPALEELSGPSSISVMPEMDPVQLMPEAKRQEFMTLESLGRRLYEQGVSTPAYRATFPIDIADHLVGSGILRPGVVVKGEDRIFIFTDGELSTANNPRLAGNDDLVGFSNRLITLPTLQGSRLVTAVSRLIGQSGESLRPCLLVRSELDRVVLASQGKATESLGLTLDQTAYTSGRFELAGNMPFRYVVTDLLTMDKRRHHLPSNQETSSH